MHDSLIIRIGVKSIPTCSCKKYTNIVDFINRKYCFKKIQNDNNLCSFGSIAIAIQFVENTSLQDIICNKKYI